MRFPLLASRQMTVHLGVLLTLLVLLCPAAFGQATSPSDNYILGHQAFAAKDYDRARRMWMPLARAGDARAQISIGSLYDKGFGVEQDNAKAAAWFRRAAAQGLAAAQYNLGNAYQNGRGVSRDEAEAAYWWTKAAEQDFAAAQFNLATHYYYGRGIDADPEKALYWYQRAAENGHQQAQLLIRSNRLARPSDAEADTSQSTQSEPVASSPIAEPQASEKIDGLLGTDWILAQNPDHFTIQLSAMSDMDRVRKFIRQHQLEGQLAYYLIERNQKTLYVLILGSYPDKPAATGEVRALPDKLRASPPWTRPFAEIQRAIRG